ncbi:type II toxin-antitoxin system ParD family antitoxin [Rhizobium sp. BG4]|uniref:ribbon-helix-helix domain-containing protein n=1 Tax=Rhizobium sp. BG4 TaxID=2613770 RepID=UPI00193DA9AE|nr:type II toxin-antitoxin system ParD family antitoxin [Rhizobium sp. BG4]QRM44467.1 type II toxin-antitoxin system ParD family antitoxin [Rhizobium sp. BG4]
MARLTISLSDQQSDWVESRVSKGNYANAEDYLRDLILMDRTQQGETLSVTELQDIVAASRASGTGKRSVDEIFAEAEALAARRTGAS